jgi:hypothetical protein
VQDTARHERRAAEPVIVARIDSPRDQA